MIHYEITKIEHFVYRPNGDIVEIHYSDLPSGWHWRLVVNGDPGDWTRADFISHHGYAAVSEYWSIPAPWRPFRLDYTERLIP